MSPEENRHIRVHRYNPNINYILTENCPYCKLEKRLNYGNIASHNSILRINNNRINNNRINNRRLTNSRITNSRITNSRINNSSITSNINSIYNLVPIHTPRNSLVPRHTPRDSLVPIHTPRNSLVPRYTPRNSLVPRYTPRDSLARYNTRNMNQNVLSRHNTTILDRSNLDNDYEDYSELEDVQVPTSLFTVNNGSNINLVTTDNNFCAICQDELPHFSIVRKLRCGHSYHQYCIDKWLEYNITCPLCNDELN